MGIVAVTIGLWAVHGGVLSIVAGGTDRLMSIGRVLGLLAALAAMGGIVLAVRPVWLERTYGLDRLWGWHRWVGIATVVLILAHAVVDTLAWASVSDAGFVDELLSLIGQEGWMLSALVATGLFTIIGLSSWRRIKNAIAYETWYFLHLSAYVAVLLGFGHQVTMGSDVSGDRVGLIWWSALAVGLVLIVLTSRVGGLVRAFARPVLRITAIQREADGIGSIHVSGPGLRSLRAAPGQFFIIRAMTAGLWWQPHPFSLSAAPTTAGLRFTVKALGDGSTDLLSARIGTRVVVEGPYGRFTAEEAGGAPVALIAGGVGIGPLRAVLEDCTPDQRPVVVVRLRHEGEFAHRAEIEALVAQRRGLLHVLAGPRAWFAGGDPFRGSVLRQAIPDLTDRHVFVCGPTSMERAVERGLREAGVPSAHVHIERFGV